MVPGAKEGAQILDAFSIKTSPGSGSGSSKHKMGKLSKCDICDDVFDSDSKKIGPIDSIFIICLEILKHFFGASSASRNELPQNFPYVFYALIY